MRNFPQILMLRVHAILLFPLFSFLFFPSPSSAAATFCNRTCGSPDPVPYPFGFSSDCPIRLNCSGDQVRLGGFLVRNFTTDSLLIDAPAGCNRSVRDAWAFFGRNYAMTASNTLLLLNCSSNAADCEISQQALYSRFNLTPCGNLSCSPNVGNDRTMLQRSYLDNISCGHFYSSVVIGAGKSALRRFELRTVELGWWLDGDCGICAANALCVNVTLPAGGKGVRCVCDSGFVGDGFVKGCGCRRETTGCNPSKFVRGRCSGRTKIVAVLIGGVAAGAALMVSVSLLRHCIRRRRSASWRRTPKYTKHLFSQASCSVPLYSFKEIERATDGFADRNRLGTGAYGMVYVGKLHNEDELVAVKKLRHRDSDSVEEVLNEVKLVSSVSHPNLVRLLGCCIDMGEQILVYEYMPNGTLSQHLQREGSRPGLPWTVRLTVAADTAAAVAHLHSAVHPPIYHRDIKSSNILLDCGFNSKVADFGLYRMVVTDSSHISTAPQGTPGYLDPQYHQNFHLSDKSDVYSFGVVLVEIITAMKVVDFSRAQSEVNLAVLAVDRIGKGRVEEIIDPFLLGHRHGVDAWTLSSIHKAAELAFRCLAFDRDMRPSMMEVAEELEQIRVSGWAPSADDESMFPAEAEASLGSPPPPSDASDEKSRGPSKSSRSTLVGTRTTAVDVRGEDSPLSVVQDPWLSEQSSPSTSSLLGNASR